MSRRNVSSVVVVALLVGLLGVATLLPVPYVTMSPGPTVNVLAEQSGKPAVEIDGAPTYPTDGSLRLTTVSVTSPGSDISLVEALSAWFDGTRAVYPRDAIYPPEQSAQDVRRQSSVQMVSSQDTAVAAALTELGHKLPLRVEVLAVTPGSPAEGKLEVRDRILEVDGTAITDVEQVSQLIQRSGTDRPVDVVVKRDGRRVRVTLTPEPSSDDAGRAVVGVQIGTGYDFPFQVDVNIGDQIGGPSAGLVFSLAVYDELTKGSLIDGNSVAGTGTISADGKVGPIGGIQQKIVAAADAGAQVFLVPTDNCDSAVGADVSEDEIRLVRVATLGEAVDALQTYADDPGADLPSCA